MKFDHFVLFLIMSVGGIVWLLYIVLAAFLL